MEVLRLGDNSAEVKKLQALLKTKGFNILVDGDFGPNTEDAVEAFQRRCNLDDDGVVGEMTWNALLDGEEPVGRINKTKYVLTTKSYYEEIHEKRAVVLHHTNGWTVRKGTKDSPSMNHFNWWTSKAEAAENGWHVSTAYSIDYKGNIYEHFNPQYWAFHHGIGGNKTFLDEQSIGIELCNEGAMVKENGKYYWITGSKDIVKIPYNRIQDTPVHVEQEWRGYNYFAPYSKEQMDSTIYLVNYLCDRFGIEKNLIDDLEYRPNIVDGNFEGIYSHVNVRGLNKHGKYDKWDLSPAFDFSKFKEGLFK